MKEATVGEGPTMKRSQPKARGSAGPIRKRTSHIRIILTDEIEIKTRVRKRPRKEQIEKERSHRKPPRQKRMPSACRSYARRHQTGAVTQE